MNSKLLENYRGRNDKLKYSTLSSIKLKKNFSVSLFISTSLFGYKELDKSWYRKFLKRKV